jgi:hypothetical protein
MPYFLPQSAGPGERTARLPPLTGRPGPSRFRPPSALDRWCLARLAAVAEGVPLRFVLWDGTACNASQGSPQFTLHISSRSMLRRLMRDPDLGFGEGYVDGREARPARRARGRSSPPGSTWWSPIVPCSRATSRAPAGSRRT